ncbi:MAG: single-stranded DNA-binding protein [Clostridium sp.]|nr:single-stranded DNA-binding protein [Bacteroides sp.]MCM1197439.1 single-stranded DNA-binding protein [Clostridium sp.]
MSLNKVMLIGNVGQDPEVRYLDGNASNAKVASFRLATTERYRDRNGEMKENTEWHSVVAWRNLADIIEKYVKKGTQLYVEGRIRTRSWDDQGGNKRYTTEILADNLQLLGRKSDNPGAQGQPYQGGNQYGQQPQGYAPQPAYGQQQYAAPQGAPQTYGGQPQYAPQPQPPQYQTPAAPQIDNASEPEDDLPF